MQNRDLAEHWHSSSNYLINLTVANLDDLAKASQKLSGLGVKVTEFREPDLDNQLTAIAFLSGPTTKKVTGNLQLALKEYSRS